MNKDKKINKKKILTGNVISNKMNKTIVVCIEYLKKHPRYKKYIKHSKKLKVHDENGLAKLKDRVKIIECRPISKDKSFRLLKFIKKAEV